jgi:enoyl-CoA hydratase
VSDKAPIIYTVEGSIARIVLNRPEKRNAINIEMINALAKTCSSIECNSSIRAVILSANGTAFCAGGDIDEWSSFSAIEFGKSWLNRGNRVFDLIARLPQPVIAVLDGHVMGGGLELAACADFRIAEEDIKIGLPETSLGIIPGWSGTQRTVRRFGVQIVKRMALFGEILSAQHALDAGILDYVVPTNTAMDAAYDMAQKIVMRSPHATAITKIMINIAEGEETGNALDALAGAVAFGLGDLEEGLTAFREKRKPQF